MKFSLIRRSRSGCAFAQSACACAQTDQHLWLYSICELAIHQMLVSQAGLDLACWLIPEGTFEPRHK